MKRNKDTTTSFNHASPRPDTNPPGPICKQEIPGVPEQAFKFKNGLSKMVPVLPNQQKRYRVIGQLPTMPLDKRSYKEDFWTREEAVMEARRLKENGVQSVQVFDLDNNTQVEFS